MESATLGVAIKPTLTCSTCWLRSKDTFANYQLPSNLLIYPLLLHLQKTAHVQYVTLRHPLKPDLGELGVKLSLSHIHEYA